MVVHRAHGVALGLEPIVHHIHLGPFVVVEGEVGAGGGVGRAQQGNAIAISGRLQIGPILRIPGEPQAKGLVEGLGPVHVLHPHRHMAQPAHPHLPGPIGASIQAVLMAQRPVQRRRDRLGARASWNQLPSGSGGAMGTTRLRPSDLA